LIWLFSVSLMILALMLLTWKVCSITITVAETKRLELFFFKSSLIYLSFLVLYTLCVYLKKT
jgi:hypothetical protein